MKFSETIDQLIPALWEVQKVVKPPKKLKTAEVVTSKGSKYTYDYADLDMVMASVREELAKNGLMILQGMGVEPAMNAIGLVTRVVHVASGQWVETFSEIDRKCSAQEQGAEQTLFRRYEIVNLFAIVPEHKAKTTHAQPKVNTVNGRTPVQSNARAPIQPRGAFDDFQGGPPVGRFR